MTSPYIDDVTIIAVGTIIFTFLGVMVRTCFLSKCISCNVCYGLINVQRDGVCENEEMKINSHILDNNNNV